MLQNGLDLSVVRVDSVAVQVDFSQSLVDLGVLVDVLEGLVAQVVVLQVHTENIAALESLENKFEIFVGQLAIGYLHIVGSLFSDFSEDLALNGVSVQTLVVHENLIDALLLLQMIHKGKRVVVLSLVLLTVGVGSFDRSVVLGVDQRVPDESLVVGDALGPRVLAKNRLSVLHCEDLLLDVVHLGLSGGEKVAVHLVVLLAGVLSHFQHVFGLHSRLLFVGSLELQRLCFLFGEINMVVLVEALGLGRLGLRGELIEQNLLLHFALLVLHGVEHGVLQTSLQQLDVALLQALLVRVRDDLLHLVQRISETLLVALQLLSRLILLLNYLCVECLQFLLDSQENLLFLGIAVYVEK